MLPAACQDAGKWSSVCVKYPCPTRPISAWRPEMLFEKDDRNFRGEFTKGSSQMPDGATFDGAARRFVDAATFRERLTATLQRAFPTPKRLAQVTRQTPRAAENQMAGLNSVSAHSLVNLMRESEDVLREVLAMAGRPDLALTDAEYRRRLEAAARVLAGDDE